MMEMTFIRQGGKLKAREIHLEIIHLLIMVFQGKRHFCIGSAEVEIIIFKKFFHFKIMQFVAFDR